MVIIWQSAQGKGRHQAGIQRWTFNSLQWKRHPYWLIDTLLTFWPDWLTYNWNHDLTDWHLPDTKLLRSRSWTKRAGMKTIPANLRMWLFPRKTLRGNSRQNISVAELILGDIATKVISESSIDTNHCFKGGGGSVGSGKDTTRQEATFKKVRNETICFGWYKTAMTNDHPGSVIIG